MALVASIQQIDPFLISYVLGLAILLFFVRDRLDVPRTALKGPEANNPRAPQFINRLPPSLIRVRRFFFLACFVYFVGLGLFFTVICMLFAFGADGLVPEEIGFDSAQAASGALPQITGSETEVTTGNAFWDALLQFVSRESAISEHPWNPLVVSLGMVGILPSLPYIGRGENIIRRWSLWVVGIPSSVLALWRGLRRVKLSEFYDAGSNTQESQWLQETCSIYHRLSGASEDQRDEFRERLAKLKCYCETKWPDEHIKLLFKGSAPSGLDPDVEATLQEADDLANLSLAVEAAQATGIPHRGFEEAGPQALHGAPKEIHSPGEAIDEAREILAKRWNLMSQKLRGNPDENQYGQTDICSLMVALYAERTPFGLLSDDDPDCSRIMREWIKTARAAERRTATSINLFLFAALIAIGIACAIIFILAGISDSRLAIEIPQDSSQAKVTLSIAAKMAIMLLPTLVVVHMVRGALDSEGRWQPWVTLLEPRTLEYAGLACLGFFVSTVVQLIYIFVDPLIGNFTEQTLQLSEVFSRSNLSEAAWTAIPGTVFALLVSLAFDQEERPSRWFATAIGVLMALLPVMLGAALLFDPDFANVPGLLSNADYVNTEVFLWLSCVAVGFIVFLFVVISIYGKRRNSRRGGAG